MGRGRETLQVLLLVVHRDRQLIDLGLEIAADASVVVVSFLRRHHFSSRPFLSGISSFDKKDKELLSLGAKTNSHGIPSKCILKSEKCVAKGIIWS